jgi:toxin ParE1/3/4
MREVILRPDAEADIEDAADYTIEQWGPEQAQKYVRELRHAIELLATTALRYPIYDNVHPGLRRNRSGMHHIYYLATDERVEVLNVVHVERDPGLHLKVEAWRDWE